MVKYVSTYTKGTCKKRSAKDLFNNAYASELHQQVIAIQIGTHTICLYVCLFVCVEVLKAQSTQWGHVEHGQFT